MATLFDVGENLERVRERIAAAARRAGRDPEEVTLVAVTKTHPVSTVMAALEAGLRHLGENRVEELESKRRQVEERLPPGAPRPVWHMVGHVQSRRAAAAAASADMIHSVDSVKLAQRLDRFAAEAGRTIPVLLEVNLSGEASKYGVSAAEWRTDPHQWAALVELVTAVAGLSHLALQGLMTMAPWVDDEGVVRPVFRSARLLLHRLTEGFPAAPWQHLSMGMTDDLELAVEEGATLVRVGRAIFGPRLTG